MEPAVVDAASSGDGLTNASSSGPVTEALGTVTESSGMVDDKGKIGEFEIEITDSDFGGAIGAGAEHVPEPLIFAEVQPELMVPSRARGTEPQAPEVATASAVLCASIDFHMILESFRNHVIWRLAYRRVSRFNRRTPSATLSCPVRQPINCRYPNPVIAGRSAG